MRTTSGAGRGRAFVWAIVWVLSAGVTAHPQEAKERERPWRVLTLLGAGTHVPAAAALEQAFRTALTEGAAPRTVTFHIEVADELSLDFPPHEPELRALLRRKYGGMKLDLVAPMGDPAIEFAERHRDELWPGIPIVFGSASPDLISRRGARSGSTGVVFDFHEAETLRLARRLQPEATRLVLIAGASDYDRSWPPRLREAARMEGQGLEVTELFARPLPEVLDAVAGLPEKAIVLYTTINRGAEGETYVPAVVARQIAQRSTAPVYSTFESQIGYGVVGGAVESFDAHGRRAAAQVLSVLRGTPPDRIPVAGPAPPVPTVDWRALRRWRLDEAALPAGSRLLFRSTTFWEEYGLYAGAAATALALQTGLIVALVLQSRRRGRAEAAVRRQQAELLHAGRLAAVGELAASIAHEVNQPLGAIVSNAEAGALYLEATPPRLDQIRAILKDVRDESLRASAVVREIRALSRKAPPRAQPLSLNEVVGEALPILEAEAQRRGVLLELELADALPAIDGDRVQLLQVLLNLALNGLEALGAEGPAPRRLTLGTRAEADAVGLSVADTGPGIAEEMLPRLFESFFTTKEDGLGLGLSITRTIVEAHGGRITAANRPGRGALFRVSLPARGAADAAQRPD